MPKKQKTDIAFGIDDYSAPETINHWSEAQVDKYLTKMRDIEFNSKCLCQIVFHYDLVKGQRTYKKLNLELAPISYYTKPECGEQKTDWRAFSEQCLNNIKSGKCIDPFVVEHVGKVYFADKYGKQK